MGGEAGEEALAAQAPRPPKVLLTYRRLPTGEGATFQPEANDMAKAVGAEAQRCLEAALLRRSCLEVGDVIEVTQRDVDRATREGATSMSIDETGASPTRETSTDDV